MSHSPILPPRIFYVGMVCTSRYLERGERQGTVGAASGKMLSIVSALRLVKRRAFLVSLPFVVGGTSHSSGLIVRDNKAPAVFLPVPRSRSQRKLFGSLILAWFALRRVRRQDTVLFYNHAVEYLMTLVILRIRGIRAFHDIEDLPIRSEPRLRGLINRLSYDVTRALTAAETVTVSNEMGRNLNLGKFLAVHGVASVPVDDDGGQKWAELDGGGALRVHFGGSMASSTGLRIFCDAVRYISENASQLGRELNFVVTGFGALDQIKALAGKLHAGPVLVEVHNDLSRNDYVQTLQSCHASLSLKDPASDIASTTFPSKVIEVTSFGLSLVTSQVSDVSGIFDDDSAWLLPEYHHQTLAAILIEMTNDPQAVRRRAEAGQAVAMDRFTPLIVGQDLAEFLEVEPYRHA